MQRPNVQSAGSAAQRPRESWVNLISYSVLLPDIEHIWAIHDGLIYLNVYNKTKCLKPNI